MTLVIYVIENRLRLTIRMHITIHIYRFSKLLKATLQISLFRLVTKPQSFGCEAEVFNRRTSSVTYSGVGTFFGQGGLKIVRSCQRLGGEAPQTPLFSNARFYEQDTQQTYFDRHQLHARSSDRNFFRIIFYRGKQDCLLPLGFSNHARITTHVFVKCKYLNDKTKK